MALSGEEIRARLSEFASRWTLYDRSERAEAQTFLNELFACYGTHRSDVATFEEPQSGKFLDCIWPRNCIIEMKAPSEANRLAKHREQALAYWRNSADPSKNLPAPRYVVLCAFRKLEVWEPGSFPNEPRTVIDLIELPERYDTLLFLTGHGRDAVFTGSQQDVTREAVAKVAELFHRLADRHAAPESELQDFILQSVWCMFAEDLSMIPEHEFTVILEQLLENPRRSSADDLGRLFELLNSPPSVPRQGMYAGVPYANGGLFAEATRVHLEPDEVRLLLEAARDYRWNEVQPSIFGSLLEGGLGRSQQWALGAHYTHEADIQKIVQPTIVRPWRERIENCTTLAQATKARTALSTYTVLDPACGSGNFLYVAYRELRRIERDLNEKIAELERHAGRTLPEAIMMGAFPLSNMKGIELEGFAVKLARVTLWMGHKLAIDEVGLAEDPLPLADLSGIRRGDALRLEWPRADAVIGNPPFHGSQHVREELGDDYAAWLADRFGVGIRDYCVYWFRRAHEHLPDGGRAGFVATNSVRQNRGRAASLDYIVSNGGVITDAVSTQKWPGDAAVHVSLVNWVKGDHDGIASLDGVEVPKISSRLAAVDSEEEPPATLAENRGLSFQGPTPGNAGFVLSEDEASFLLKQPGYEKVVRPYMGASDLARRVESRPSRWIIDFGMMELEEASRYPRALEVVRERVKPERDSNNREQYRRFWWRFVEPRPALRDALTRLDRFLAVNCHGKRVLFAWCQSGTCAGNATINVALDSDYAFGILTSSFHSEWAWKYGSTIKDDIRYTPTSCFDTFPWPDYHEAHADRIAGISADIAVERANVSRGFELGLTQIYNSIEDGGYRDLADLHRQLDEAVAKAYGWPLSVERGSAESNRRLLALNLAIGHGEFEYRPFRPE